MAQEEGLVWSCRVDGFLLRGRRGELLAEEERLAGVEAVCCVLGKCHCVMEPVGLVRKSRPSHEER